MKGASANVARTVTWNQGAMLSRFAAFITAARTEPTHCDVCVADVHFEVKGHGLQVRTTHEETCLYPQEHGGARIERSALFYPPPGSHPEAETVVMTGRPCPDCDADLEVGWAGKVTVLNVQHDRSCPSPEATRLRPSPNSHGGL